MRVLAVPLVLFAAACSSRVPVIPQETLAELQAAHSVFVKVEYWPGLHDDVVKALRREVAPCAARIVFADSEASADLTVYYVHLQALCVDCEREPVPEGFEVRILRGERELFRWKRPNVGCNDAICIVKQAMRATGKVLCSREAS